MNLDMLIETMDGLHIQIAHVPDRTQGAMIAEAIPPAYTRWIGEQLIDIIVRERQGVA